MEAKGGSAGLGQRQSNDGRNIVEQGTIEYLEAIAVDMMNEKNRPLNQQWGRTVEEFDFGAET